MTVDRAEFGDFFAEVRGGHRPFRWQERLLDQILRTGRWPDQLVAPTGAGKTSVVDVHVFAVTLMACGHPVRVPRRLSLVVDRRALVDDQHEHAQRIAGLLDDAAAGSLLGRMADALRSLCTAKGGRPLTTALLRGGAPPSRQWLEDPAGCAVVCATPDMWGSRLLLSGYGSRAQAWPREAGLLAYDSVVVVDEAHLSQQLVTTARRVADLAEVAEEPLGVPTLQVVETTATPRADAGVAVGVEPADLDVDTALRQRLTTPKPVALLPLPVWPIPRSGPANKSGVVALADEAVRLREKYGPTVGCFVNSVKVATAVATELRGRGLETRLICGRMRPYDVSRLRPPTSKLLTIDGDDTVDVLVSTQSLEVGVDLDLAAAVTELAPGGPVVQRAGRVNRLGERATEVTVVVPAGELAADAMSGPYSRDELVAAHSWLLDRSTDPAGLAPWALREHRPPVPAARRDLWQRLELAQAWHLARTSDELAARQDDLDLWLSDDLDEPDHEFGIVVRRALPDDSVDAVRLIQALPPRKHEVFPVSIRQASKIRSRLAGSVILVRPTEERPRALDLSLEEPIRPGDLLVIDAATPLFVADVVDQDGTERAADVLEAVNDPDSGTFVFRIEWDDDRRILDVIDPDQDLTEQLNDLGKRLGLTGDQMAAAEVISHEDYGPQRLVRLLVVGLHRAAADEDLRQTWTPSRTPVTLQRHAEAVADRAAIVADRLRLDAELVHVLRHAGLHHDDGKSDERFQRLLRGPSAQPEPLAKSLVRSTRRNRQLRTEMGLPPGWRHEQLSVVEAWDKLSGLAEPQQELAARLVGTSHGYGRHGFPHTSKDLTSRPGETATTLFDEGLWDELIERTHLRWGVWGCAYLEALLRAADGQVSAEGS
ncbi:MAG TPA: type I-U CRISPR-associated helicase/endonuclease Cas3 [Actinoplanes sp.]|nr:type I-U CRISPR-associated helicase/endonuclease Cas3 [Actinoplanes sp.]